MRKFISYLLFFPSITFSLIKAEISPYGLLYSIVNIKKIPLNAMLFIALLFMSSFFGIINHERWDFEIVRSIAAYLNPVLLYFVVLKSDNETINNLIKVSHKVFYILLFIGVLQVTGLSSVLGLGLLLEFLMNRGADGVIGAGRGIALLSSEPSRAGYELLFMYVLFRSFSHFTPTKTVLIDMLFCLFILLFIRSATGSIFLLIYMGFLYKKYAVAIIPFFVVYLALFTGPLSIKTDGSFRALDLISQSIVAIQNGNFWALFLSASGFRGISVFASYLSGFQHLFGHGVGFWEVSSITALKETGYLASDITYFSTRGEGFTSVRPTSYIGSLMLDMGLIGVSIFLYLIRDIFIVYKENKGVFFSFIFYIFFIGSIGNPIPWLVLAIVVAKAENNQCE